MVLALVKKELRDTRALAAVALGVYWVYVTKFTVKTGPLLDRLLSYVPGPNIVPADVPFVLDNFESMLGLVGTVLAIALGLRQSVWEPSQGTSLYLLHLPLRRRTIFLTKLLTGTGLLLACTLAPILGYAIWAATPGTHAGPFEWSMTAPVFRVWLTLPLVYLGAFASGIRPARWIGSRLLPLAAVPLPAVLSYVLPFWRLLGLPLLLLTAAVLVTNILWEAATRDY